MQQRVDGQWSQWSAFDCQHCSCSGIIGAVGIVSLGQKRSLPPLFFRDNSPNSLFACFPFLTTTLSTFVRLNTFMSSFPLPQTISHRTCSNPAPLNGGAECSGASQRAAVCARKCQNERESVNQVDQGIGRGGGGGGGRGCECQQPRVFPNPTAHLQFVRGTQAEPQRPRADRDGQPAEPVPPTGLQSVLRRAERVRRTAQLPLLWGQSAGWG